MRGTFVDLVGERFHRLIVIRRVENRGKQARWSCRCDCGQLIEAATADLRSGNTKSCGCLQKETLRKRSITHGKTKTRLYVIWKSMKRRCNDSNSKDWGYYGGRGIKVCDDWENFEPFYKWAVQEGYDEFAPKGICTLDRINNDNDYSPDNCRWVDMAVQNINKRNVKRLRTYA